MQIPSKIEEGLLPKTFCESSITVISKPTMKITDQYSGKCKKSLTKLVNQN